MNEFAPALMDRCHENEALVVDSQQMEHGGVEVADVDDVVGDIVAERVRGADGDAWFDAAADHPDRIAAGVVVASVASDLGSCSWAWAGLQRPERRKTDPRENHRPCPVLADRHDTPRGLGLDAANPQEFDARFR